MSYDPPQANKHNIAYLRHETVEIEESWPVVSLCCDNLVETKGKTNHQQIQWFDSQSITQRYTTMHAEYCENIKI